MMSDPALRDIWVPLGGTYACAISGYPSVRTLTQPVDADAQKYYRCCGDHKACRSCHILAHVQLLSEEAGHVSA
jgi:hypothetical protein